ncbi:hypothetical protein J4573_08710 [Actinomadura barringtoniae]|uniref:Uncharacterized protein n=1 Tax=Actinomadura barringtoniae TaxID=1427535 RepID=A0A939PCJ7_9ACTN|nr:hypothetical protein [Actinomadura barringtoniae]MBO2447164.1 hypothetical protein [Actinomadura barringtoniae]
MLIGSDLQVGPSGLPISFVCGNSPMQLGSRTLCGETALSSLHVQVRRPARAYPPVRGGA